MKLSTTFAHCDLQNTVPKKCRIYILLNSYSRFTNVEDMLTETSLNILQKIAILQSASSGYNEI